ncbi:NAD(P)-binding domain-containing protein [Bdellovibrionota bacterium FG-1]
MRIESLRVLHIRKTSQHDPLRDAKIGARITEQLAGAFVLDSCQRWVWVCSKAQLAQADIGNVQGLRIFAGVEAYTFLLRVATGLESQILGETDIFGQLKEAWRRNPGSSELGVFMQRVFEDTKDIRSRYLQNLGGASYGSLVRMILGERKGPTLLIGAGQLAQSVAPYLMDQELWISNRNPENLFALKAELESRASAQHLGHDRCEVRMVSKDEETQAWREAANVVICVPFDEVKDQERVQARAGRADSVVIHLGGMRDHAGVWNELPGFYSLDDLFALQKAQGDVRMTQIAQAARACEEKAKLRALGASITIPHGWEDLAVFA